MLTDQLQQDLHTAMKARDELATSVLRLAVAAVKEAQVSGKEARTLTDDEVLALLAREVKRREESAEAFRAGGRDERADRELAERDLLATYLPAPLTDDELSEIVDRVLAAGGFDSPAQMGAAMKAVTAEVAGRRDGKAVSGLVRARLGAG